MKSKLRLKRTRGRRNKNRKEEEGEDEVMKSFEDRINKRLKKIEEAGDDKTINKDSGFEDVEVEED